MKKIVNVIIDKIKRDYIEDIDLLVQYGSSEGLALYFIPNSERGKELSFQFVIDNVGYDLFPITWERMTSIVSLDTPITYVVGNSEVFYSRNVSCEERFNRLKMAVESLCSEDSSELLLSKSYEYLNDAYVNLYNINLASSDLTDRRIEASKIIGKLAQAVGYANATYFNDGLRKGIKESFKYKLLPKDYRHLIESVINAESKEDVTVYIEKLLWNVRVFLKELLIGYAEQESYDMMTGYYEELKRVILQLEQAVEVDDQEELFMITAFFMEEVAQFLTKVEEGVWYNDRNVFNEYKSSVTNLVSGKLFDYIRTKDYSNLVQEVQLFEETLVSQLESNGVKIAKYSTVEEFEVALNER